MWALGLALFLGTKSSETKGRRLPSCPASTESERSSAAPEGHTQLPRQLTDWLNGCNPFLASAFCPPGTVLGEFPVTAISFHTPFCRSWLCSRPWAGGKDTEIRSCLHLRVPFKEISD